MEINGEKVERNDNDNNNKRAINIGFENKCRDEASLQSYIKACPSVGGFVNITFIA